MIGRGVYLLPLLVLGCSACGPPREAQHPFTPVGTDESRPRHTELKPHKELFNAGLAVFSGFAVVSAWSAIIGDGWCITNSCPDHTYDLLYLPVIGPAIGAALPGAAGTGQVLLIADGALQATGLLMMLIGALWHHEVIVEAETSRARWLIVPGSSRALGGLTLVVSF